LTGAFTEGIVAAPEHLNRRERVRVFDDCLADVASRSTRPGSLLESMVRRIRVTATPASSSTRWGIGGESLRPRGRSEERRER
jgi:hypothetical protein